MSDEEDVKEGAGIEVSCGPNHGELTLICDRESFHRLRALVLPAAGYTSAVDDVQAVLIVERRLTTPRPVRLRDRFVLIGCATVGFLFVFVLIAGVWTIVGWMR
jgi:hypothetical protein